MSGDVVAHPPFGPRRGAARATTWWGKAWVRAVEEVAFAEGDLRAARSLARAGGVGGISVTGGRVVAAVADHVHWGLFTVDALLVEVVAAEAGRIGALLAGDLPHALVEHLDEAGVEVLPFGGELEASCTCEGWLDPCPHALAVLYQVAWLLDADPLALLHLRGLARDDLLARLHARTVRSAAGLDGPDGPDDAQAAALDAAADAAARAARILELLDRPEGGSIDHLL